MNIRYDFDAMRFAQSIGSRLDRRLSENAKQYAIKDGRDLITKSDMSMVLKKTLQEFIDDLEKI